MNLRQIGPELQRRSIGRDCFFIPAGGAQQVAKVALVFGDRGINLCRPADQLQGDGSAPLNVYFRIPPDIFYSDRPNATLRLAYRYNSIPIGPISSMYSRIKS